MRTKALFHRSENCKNLIIKASKFQPPIHAFCIIRTSKMLESDNLFDSQILIFLKHMIFFRWTDELFLFITIVFIEKTVPHCKFKAIHWEVQGVRGADQAEILPKGDILSDGDPLGMMVEYPCK